MFKKSKIILAISFILICLVCFAGCSADKNETKNPVEDDVLMEEFGETGMQATTSKPIISQIKWDAKDMSESQILNVAQAWSGALGFEGFQTTDTGVELKTLNDTTFQQTLSLNYNTTPYISYRLTCRDNFESINIMGLVTTFKNIFGVQVNRQNIEKAMFNLISNSNTAHTQTLRNTLYNKNGISIYMETGYSNGNKYVVFSGIYK